MSESVKLNTKGIMHEHCTLGDKVVSQGVQVNNSETATEIKQISAWMVNDESEVSQC